MNLLFLVLGIFLGSILGVLFISLCIAAKRGEDGLKATNAHNTTEYLAKKRHLPVEGKEQCIRPLAEMWN